MFMKGKHVVKRYQHKFMAASADMALEQTINRSQKSSSGIIGCTKQKQFVAEWEITHHELGSEEVRQEGGREGVGEEGREGARKGGREAGRRKEEGRE